MKSYNLTEYPEYVFEIKLTLFYNEMSQTQLAKRLGISKSYLCIILKGKRPLPKKIFNKLEKFLNDFSYRKKERRLGAWKNL